MKRSIERMGVTGTARTLLRLNQTDGFDCQGCAWPDPEPGHPHPAEFCENGAKAVAEEATRRRVGPEFFAAHPISGLRERTDYWLGQHDQARSGAGSPGCEAYDEKADRPGGFVMPHPPQDSRSFPTDVGRTRRRAPRFASSLTTNRAVAPRRTTRRPTRWCRSTGKRRVEPKHHA